jgi:hypothetical protein
MRDSWFEWETILMVIAGLSFALLFVHRSIILVIILLTALVAGLVILGLFSPPEGGP